MDTFTRIAQTKSPDFLASAVRNVMIGSWYYNQHETILSACPGIQNLFCPASVAIGTAALDILPLRHLYCISSVFDSSAGDAPIFAHLTHLHLSSNPQREDAARFVATLAQIPNLSHLAMIYIPHPGFHSHIIDTCTHLRILVVLYSAFRSSNESLALSDVRIVSMSSCDYRTDWKLGILTGDDIWARAEAIVASRILG